jgi:hypothetical protein
MTQTGYMTVEKWNTRFGASQRLVTRKGNGQFVTNISRNQMVEAGLLRAK